MVINFLLLKTILKKKKRVVNIKVIDTGLSSLTGKRLFKLKKELNDTFMLTYGDGLSNVNIKKLLKFHKKHKKNYYDSRSSSC